MKNFLITALLSWTLVGCSLGGDTEPSAEDLRESAPQETPPEVLEIPQIQEVLLQQTEPEQTLKTKVLEEGFGGDFFSQNRSGVIRFKIWNQQGHLIADNEEHAEGFSLSSSQESFLLPGLIEGMEGMKLREKREIIMTKEKSFQEDLPLTEETPILSTGEWIRAEVTLEELGF